MRTTGFKRNNPKSALWRPGGFTLVEMVASMTIVAIIMAALGSVVMLAGRALNTSANGSTPTAATARTAVDMITSDLQTATTITNQTATSITMTVPARGTDTSPETISYAWDGVSGDPLTRQYNGGTLSSIATNVTSLNLSYLTKAAAGAGTQPVVQSVNQTLITYTSPTANTFSVDSTLWPAEWFSPTLPSNAVYWSITDIKFRLQRIASNTGTLNFLIYAVNSSNQPTGTALAQANLDITTVPTTAGGTWVDLVFPAPVAGISPRAHMAVVISASSTTAAGNFIYDGAAATQTNMGTTYSTNSGSTWSTTSQTQQGQFQVNGTVSTPG